MLLLFAAFFGVMQLSDTYALVLNAGNIGAYCGPAETFCSLYDTDITSIAPNTFEGYTSMTELAMDHNQITSLASGSFKWLSSLQTLNLYNNQITSITPGAFNWLTNLINLDLQSNQISSIAPGMFNWLVVLQTLNLDRNQIASISSTAFNWLITLVNLYLSHNKMTSVDPNTFNIVALRNLTLSYNQIAGIDGNYFSLAHDLTTFDLSNNCNINGLEDVYYDNGGPGNFNTPIDDNNCAHINSTTVAGFIANLAAGNYSYNWFLNMSQWTWAISFNHVWATNKFLSNVFMYYDNPNGYIEPYYNRSTYVLYYSWTNATYGGSPFAGTLYAPMSFTTINVPWMTDVSSLMRFWALTHRVDFDTPVFIRMPAIWKNANDIVKIYSSEAESIYGPSGAGRTFEKTGVVVDPNSDGITYVDFTGTHASRWVVWSWSYTGTFVINNDAISTTTTGVTLNISGVWLSNMRFQNDGTGGTRWPRVTFSTSQAWTLSAGTGTKTVYGQFDADGNTGTIEILASDEIEYTTACAPLPGELNNCNILFYCTTTWTYCNLSAQGITGIAPDAFINHAGLTILQLDNNSITSLDDWDFKRLSNLTNLILNNNLIASPITNNTFSGLDYSLTSLALYANMIPSVDSEAFNALSGLTWLNLESNAIAAVADGTFKSQSHITTLGLNNNAIASPITNGTFSGLSSLINLHLDNNFIPSIQDFNSISSLTYLNLNNNLLASLPESLPTKLPNLNPTWLQINTNKLCTWGWSSTLLNFVNTKAGSTLWQTTQTPTSCPVPAWSFVINNDAGSTNVTAVTLNITGTWVSSMRFQNDGTGGTRWSRIPFTTSRPWTLSAGTGTKNVYAQFGNINTYDAIIYDTTGSTECTWTTCWNITLEIVSNISGYCEIGDSVDFGLTGYSASSRTLESWFPTTLNNSGRFCNDLKGKGTSRTLDINSTDLFNISTNNPAHTIASSNVSVKNPAATVVQWVCTPNAGSSLNIRTSIGGINVPLLWKVGGAGEVCKIETSQVELKIQIPMYQALGQYSGTLTITVPDLS